MSLREVPPPRRTFGDWLDGFIGAFAPAWAAQRTLHRAALLEAQAIQARYFRGAKHSRLGSRQPTRGTTANFELESAEDRLDMIYRGRQLERDNAIAAGFLNRCVDNIVGPGHTPQARARYGPRNAAKKWNDMAEGLFNEWGEEQADIRGLDSFPELQRLIYRSHRRDGDVGIALAREWQLRPYEADEIRSPYGQRLSPSMVDGVELNRKGKPVRFWVLGGEDNPSQLLPGIRHTASVGSIDAEDFIYYPRRQRLGQTRGLPGFWNTAHLLHHIDQNIESVVVAARMAACFGLIVHRKGRPGRPVKQRTRTDSGGDGDTYYERRIKPGMQWTLGPEDRVTQVQPLQPGQSWPDFVRLLARVAGLSWDLPLELAFLDFTQTNYSNARAALLQFWRAMLCEQIAFQKKVLRKVWRWRIRGFIQEGKLKDRPDFAAHGWTPPGQTWLDPTKEIVTQLLAVDAGFDTLTAVAQRQGRDLLDMLEERQRELEEMEERGIPVVRSNLTRDPGNPAMEEPEEDFGDAGKEPEEEDE